MSELDPLEAALGECREMIREAHAATKDLRAAVREAKQEARALAADEVTVTSRLKCRGSGRNWVSGPVRLLQQRRRR